MPGYGVQIAYAAIVQLVLLWLEGVAIVDAGHCEGFGTNIQMSAERWGTTRRLRSVRVGP